MENKHARSPGPGGPPTRGIQTLLGDPKKAVIKLSIPMIAAMSLQTVYHLADAIWVSGMGPESLAAVGFTFPFLFLAMAIGNGIGIGGGAAISRRIGSKDKAGADSIAAHTIIIMLICVVFFTAAMLIMAEPLIGTMGAGASLELAVTYARIMFSGIIFIFFMQISAALLRSEGDAKRAMYAMGSGAILNIILDPIFIYTLGYGVAGAAMATVLSMCIVSIITAYWLFIERKTYVSFKFRGFKFNKGIIFDILRVGFPASVSQMSMSIMAFALTTIIASVGGSDGVAVYITGWRVISLATLPMMGVASAVTSVTGAAYGAGEYRKVEISYMFALKAGVLVEIVLAVLAIIFAAQITWIFTWSEDSARIINDLILFLRVIPIFLPAVAFGMLSSSLFQGVGKGFYALVITLIRTLVFTVPAVWFFGVFLDGGLLGIWIGMVVAGVAYIPVSFVWAYSYIQRLQKQSNLKSSNEED